VVPRKEHADETIENFPVIHYSQRLPFRRACATHDPRHIPSRWGLIFSFPTSITTFSRRDCASSTRSIRRSQIGCGNGGRSSFVGQLRVIREKKIGYRTSSA